MDLSAILDWTLIVLKVCASSAVLVQGVYAITHDFRKPGRRGGLTPAGIRARWLLVGGTGVTLLADLGREKIKDTQAEKNAVSMRSERQHADATQAASQAQTVELQTLALRANQRALDAMAELLKLQEVVRRDVRDQRDTLVVQTIRISSIVKDLGAIDRNLRDRTDTLQRIGVSSLTRFTSVELAGSLQFRVDTVAMPGIRRLHSHCEGACYLTTTELEEVTKTALGLDAFRLDVSLFARDRHAECATPHSAEPVLPTNSDAHATVRLLGDSVRWRWERTKPDLIELHSGPLSGNYFRQLAQKSTRIAGASDLENVCILVGIYPDYFMRMLAGKEQPSKEQQKFALSSIKPELKMLSIWASGRVAVTTRFTFETDGTALYARGILHLVP